MLLDLSEELFRLSLVECSSCIVVSGGWFILVLFHSVRAGKPRLVDAGIPQVRIGAVL